MHSIYRITNLVNGKRYIGQTVNIKKRFHDHQNYSSNTHLKNSITKYGLENFKFEVLFEVSSKTQADKLEIALIAKYDLTNPMNGYNKDSGGSHGSPSEETRLKQRLSHLGKSLPEEQRHKISESMKKNDRTGPRNPMYGYKMSEEEKLRRSLEERGDKNPNWNNGKPVCQIDRYTDEVIAEYMCGADAFRKTRIRHINECCCGRRKTAGGYKWAFIEDYTN